MQHFLLSRAAKTLSLAQVFRMSDAEAEAMFCKVRWADTNGDPVCPHCGGLDAYDCRHHIAGAYLLRYAQEAAWREDNRRASNGEQVNRVAHLAMISKRSADFCGYWQRHHGKTYS